MVPDMMRSLRPARMDRVDCDPGADGMHRYRHSDGCAAQTSHQVPTELPTGPDSVHFAYDAAVVVCGYDESRSRVVVPLPTRLRSYRCSIHALCRPEVLEPLSPSCHLSMSAGPWHRRVLSARYCALSSRRLRERKERDYPSRVLGETAVHAPADDSGPFRSTWGSVMCRFHAFHWKKASHQIGFVLPRVVGDDWSLGRVDTDCGHHDKVRSSPGRRGYMFASALPLDRRVRC